MQVFNATFKVIRRNLPSMVIYMMVFLLLMVLLTAFYRSPDKAAFEAVKPRVVILQQDKTSAFSTGLADWLATQARIVDIPDEREKLQDALFYRGADYILRIPDGFGDAFLAGQYDGLRLERTMVPDSWGGIQLDLLVDRYINLAALYVDTRPDMPVGDLLQAVARDLAQEAPVSIESGEPVTVNRTAYFFIYMAYSMMAIMILGITSILMVFNQSDLRRRNLSAPVEMVRFNAQLVLGCLVFALGVWLIMIVLSLGMGSYQVEPTKLLLLSANALVYTLACLGISFLISQFIRKRNVQQPIANVLSLGTCFISGVFVPQSMLGGTVQTLASFTPTYWYVRAINEIDSLSVFTSQTVQPISGYLLIQAGFVIALLAVSLAVIRQKRQTQS